MNAQQRKNLLKLANYLESLPNDYKHFDMVTFAQHRGDCALPMSDEIYAAKCPTKFLSNCGTVACAVGHGPAAGIRIRAEEILSSRVEWAEYSDRVFGTDSSGWEDGNGPFDFLFGGDWKYYDNHHYGAAARIRYFLDTGRYDKRESKGAVRHYAPYRKGSRSAKRREIDAHA